MSNAKKTLASAGSGKNETSHTKPGSKTELVANAEKALAMKKAAEETARSHPESRTAGASMQVNESEGLLPIERQGERPVLERSRKVR